MSRIALAFGSFVAGIVSVFVLGGLGIPGKYTSMMVQSLSAQAIGIKIEGAEPVVPPLTVKQARNRFVGVTQPLDGMDCEGCIFENVQFTYAGGAVRLSNFSLTGPMRVEFKGAAANALAIIALVDAVNSGSKPRPIPPGSSRQRATLEKNTIKEKTFATPFGTQ